MELLQLRYFYESAKCENFAKTAEKFMVPATSVSASVKRLEQELGVLLFNRHSNRITLNANGKRLMQALQAVFSELDGAMADITAQGTDTREIRMLVRAMRSNITEAIAAFHQKHPHIAFKTVFDFHETDFEAYDIIIDEKTDRYLAYNSFPLYDLRLYMLVSENSPLCEKSFSLKQLSHMPFISLGEESNMHKILINACARAGFSPDIAVLSNDIKCFESLIASGIGIGLGREPKKHSGIACLHVTDFHERYTVHCYCKQQAAYGNVAKFLQFLKEHA